jgi:uncharacterized MAPEG superfamily protein
MTTPIWMLLAFATWTLMILFATVGVYRWGHILTGRTPIRKFQADWEGGADWYKRAMRAHANCVENLPIFAVIVFVLYVGRVTGPLVDALCVTVVIARIIHSLIHVSFEQTNAVTSLRFTFYFAQIVCFLWLIGIIVNRLS